MDDSTTDDDLNPMQIRKLPCEYCGVDSDSIKRVRTFRYMICYLAGAFWQEEYLSGCPSCLRNKIVQRAIVNIAPANLLWPIIVMPVAVYGWMQTRKPGHSSYHLRFLGIQEEYKRAREGTPLFAADAIEYKNSHGDVPAEISWIRVGLIVCLLFSLLPIIGLFFGLIGWLTTRKENDWKRRGGQIALAISIVSSAIVMGSIIAKG
jgi:hypothetical protein